MVVSRSLRENHGVKNLRNGLAFQVSEEALKERHAYQEGPVKGVLGYERLDHGPSYDNPDAMS